MNACHKAIHRCQRRGTVRRSRASLGRANACSPVSSESGPLFFSRTRFDGTSRIPQFMVPPFTPVLCRDPDDGIVIAKAIAGIADAPRTLERHRQPSAGRAFAAGCGIPLLTDVENPHARFAPHPGGASDRLYRRIRRRSLDTLRTRCLVSGLRRPRTIPLPLSICEDIRCRLKPSRGA